MRRPGGTATEKDPGTAPVADGTVGATGHGSAGRSAGRTVAVGPRILAGPPIAEAILSEAADLVAEAGYVPGAIPTLAVLQVGDDPAASVYARQIVRTASRLGAPGRLIVLDAAIETAEVVARLADLSADPDVGGIIVQLPLPGHLDAPAVFEALDPARDLDGIHPVNAGLAAKGQGGFVPSCAEAALQVLKRSGIPLEGRRAVVVGRSNVVGRPAAQLLMREHATVTICHRRTLDLAGELRRAEIVIAAAGAPGLVRGEMVLPGATLIDCGMTVVEGRVVGDVDAASVRSVAGAITPVPGGIGPVTNAVLAHHLARALHARALQVRSVDTVH
jgi:methylenetetrahydrofolate dehydrogenase (NADP+)/methenyltetrahydrofolate cyclohydrolase